MNEEPMEMELKFRVGSLDEIRARLLGLGARSLGTQKEIDRYFRSPWRDFASTGEALRLRSQGNAQILTYKGQRLPGAVKTRKELEATIDPLRGSATELLESLGFQALPDIEKTRESFVWVNPDGIELTICLDQAKDLGDFVEIEILGFASQRNQAEESLNRAAALLGLTEREDRSYLRMHLEKRR